MLNKGSHSSAPYDIAAAVSSPPIAISAYHTIKLFHIHHVCKGGGRAATSVIATSCGFHRNPQLVVV